MSNELENRLSHVPEWLEGRESILIDGISSGRYISQMARELDRGYNEVRNLIIDNGKLEELKVNKKKARERVMGKGRTKIRYPEVDKAAVSENPPTLIEMARMTDRLNGESSVRMYLQSVGLDNIRKERRSDMKTKRKIILDVLQSVVKNSLRREVCLGLSEEEKRHAMGLIDDGVYDETNCKYNVKSLRRVARVLSARDELKAGGEELNLSRIGRAAGGVPHNVVGYIMKRHGVDRNGDDWVGVPMTAEQKNIVRGACVLDMSNHDLAYFLQGVKKGIEWTSVRNYRTTAVFNREMLRLNSKLYEIEDYFCEVGENIDEHVPELSVLAGVDERVIRKKIDSRTRDESRINRALRFIYPDRKEDVPYLTSDEFR
jgi:hypothetical protein